MKLALHRALNGTLRTLETAVLAAVLASCPPLPVAFCSCVSPNTCYHSHPKSLSSIPLEKPAAKHCYVYHRSTETPHVMPQLLLVLKTLSGSVPLGTFLPGKEWPFSS